MFDGAVGDLISLLGKLPGIGPKSAQRIAFYILQNPNYDPHELATLLSTVRELVPILLNLRNAHLRGGVCNLF